MEQNIRKSNFELLRICGMLLIVFFHCIMEVKLDLTVSSILKAPISINQIVSFLLGSWGMTGVGVFFLISDYFMIQHNNFSSKKLFKIALQTSFWSIITWIICNIFQLNYVFGTKALIKAIGAPFTGKYWFVTAYIFLYVLSPFLNKIIENLNINIYRKLMIILTIIMPLYSTIYTNLTLCDLGLAIYYYFLWGYLRQCPHNRWERNAKKILLISIILIVTLSCLSSCYCTALGIATKGINRMIGRWSVLQIIPAVSLFYVFKNMNIKSCKYINTIAQATFGVYLIHEGFLSYFIWNDLFHLNILYFSQYFIPAFIGAVLLVYVIATIMDLIYKKTIEKILYRYIHVFDGIFKKVDLFMKE